MMEKFIPNDSEKAIMSCVDNYRRIKEEVCEAAVKSGRSENDVRLMAVTKTVEPLYINAVLDDGADLIDVFLLAIMAATRAMPITSPFLAVL